MFEKLLQLDNEVIIYLNSLGSQEFDSFWLFITNPVNWIWLPVITTYFLSRFYSNKKTIQLIVIGLIACCISLILVELIKRNIGRFRPINNEKIKHLLRIVTTTKSYSFVSGHSAFSMAYSVLVYQFLRNKMRFSYLIFIFPLLFAYSRLYLGVHFLTDILSGFLLGVLIAMVTNRFTKERLFNSTNG